MTSNKPTIPSETKETPKPGLLVLSLGALGAISIAQQAIPLGYLPRLSIVHTSAQQKGQIYMPGVNWVMMIVCLGLVLVFRQSSSLAGAYGIAVTADMVITSSIFFLGRESLFITGKSKMASWRKALFSAMSRNAMNPTNFFGIPPDRVIEIGSQIRL